MKVGYVRTSGARSTAYLDDNPSKPGGGAAVHVGIDKLDGWPVWCVWDDDREEWIEVDR